MNNKYKLFLFLIIVILVTFNFFISNNALKLIMFTTKANRVTTVFLVIVIPGTQYLIDNDAVLEYNKS